MAINRAPFNALVDDDGSGLTGTLWNKAQIKAVILDPVDAAIGAELLKGNNGINNATAFSTVDNLPVPPLGVNDVLVILFQFQTTSQDVAAVSLWAENTPFATLTPLPLPANTQLAARITIRPGQGQPNLFGAIVEGLISTGARNDRFSWTAVTPVVWTAGFALTMNHHGMGAGGALLWQWNVYRLKG